MPEQTFLERALDITIVTVAEAGWISAGTRLGLSKSVLSERLIELGRSLGARLLQQSR